jgi:hypothetical protein
LRKNALVEWMDFPHLARNGAAERHSRSSASAFYFATAADGGLCSPQAGEMK